MAREEELLRGRDPAFRHDPVSQGLVRLCCGTESSADAESQRVAIRGALHKGVLVAAAACWP